MFEISNQNKINSALPVITDNYNILHFDEFPILFSGTNCYGNKLIGSFSYEDYDNDFFRYFVIIVNDKQYSDFFNKRVSYIKLLNDCQEIFVIDRDINDKILLTYHMALSDIPIDYLPLENSYIPEQKALSNSLNFSFSLKGKLADFHKAIVTDVNSINQRIYSYLEESIETLRSFSLEPQIYSQPSQVGSYRLNFDIEFKQNNQQLTLFPISQDRVAEFINEYLNYVANVFPHEEDGVLTISSEASKSFQSLKNSLIDIYKSANLEPSSTISDLLVDNINSSANKLSDVAEFLKTSQSFNGIELGNYNDDGSFSSIGFLDKEYKSLIAQKLLEDEHILVSDEIISDESPQDYRILVFRINSETGKGGARLYSDYENEDFHKVLLNIDLAGKDLSNSIFTKSLNEDKVVDVKGIATRKNGVFKKLDCYL